MSANLLRVRGGTAAAKVERVHRTESTYPFLLCLLATSACMVGEDEDDDLVIAGARSAAVRIVQHNIEKKPAVLERALAKANEIDAHGLALQEVCPKEVAWLRATYGAVWTIGEVPGKKPAIVGCDLPDGTHDKPSSIVIWTGGTGGKVTPYPVLAAPANAPGSMVCVQFERAKVPVHLCSTHLISGDWKDNATGIVYDGATVREKQTTAIKQIARDEWFAGPRNHFGIIGGDFNGQPGQPPLDKLYDNALGGTGEFTEYNRSGASRNGEVTSEADGSNTESGEPFSRKIDYVFFSTNRAPIDGPAVNVIPTASDHHMLVSTVHMRK